MPQQPESGPTRPTARELAEIFGDVLPSTTSDERDHEPAGVDDSWYLRNLPPHHNSER